MIGKLFLKIMNLHTTFVVKLSPIINRWVFKAKGIEIGKNFYVVGKVPIIAKGKISIGSNFTMTSGYGINAVSNDCQGAFHVVENAVLTIGDNVGMNSTRVRVNECVTIGNHVKFGANVLVIDTDSHPIDYLIRRNSSDGTKSAPILIEDDVWIGAHSIVLKGVTIGARSVIGAGSVVTKNIPADCIAGGNPCKIIRSISK